jgi:hypothetical protein
MRPRLLLRVTQISNLVRIRFNKSIIGTILLRAEERPINFLWIQLKSNDRCANMRHHEVTIRAALKLRSKRKIDGLMPESGDCAFRRNFVPVAES